MVDVLTLAGLWPAALMGMAVWLHLHNPERLYSGAWELMRVGRYAEAADGFDDAFAARSSDAKKEEALFWSAKASEEAGRRDEALKRYGQLAAGYHGYWLPEALFTQWQLARASGQTAQAKTAQDRLLSEFPNDRWTQRMTQEAAR